MERDGKEMLDGDDLGEILKAFVESGSVHILVVDRDRRVRHFNHLTHGFAPEQVMGLPVEELVPPDYQERVRTAVEQALAVGAVTDYETALETPEGPTYFRTRVGPLRIRGSIPYASLTSYEITAEHEAREEALRERAVLSALDRVHRIIVGAKGAPEMLDGVLEEMLSIFDCERAFLLYPADPEAPYFTIVNERSHPDYPGAKGQRIPMHPVVTDALRHVLANAGAVVRNDPECNPVPEVRSPLTEFGVLSMLTTAVRPESDAPWVLGIQHCREAHVYHTEGALLSAIAARVADGITAALAQRALRESEERLRLIMENAPEAILIFDVDAGGIVEANQRAVELFQMSKEELRTKTPADISMPSQRDGSRSDARAWEHIEAALRGETPVFEWLHRNSKGEPLECEVRLLRLPYQARRWIRGSLTSIAERKRAERENERLSAQLAQAQKMQAIGQLTGGVAHDFNNLLTVIGGSLAMIEQDAADADSVRHFGELAMEACNRGAQLTQRLLAFSRQQPLRPRAVDLGELVRGMEGLLQRTLGETTRVELSLAAGLWPCEVDPVQLESAILNLSINARDAMPHGGCLTLETKNVTWDEGAAYPHAGLEARDYVMLAVSDDGEGMDEETLEKAFEPFFTTKEVGKGSGLGLSMVYGFVTQSGGHVYIDSELGHGTTITLYLPRSDDAAAPVSRAAPRGFARVGRGEVILVVEDDANLRTLIGDLLRRLGYRALLAEDGREAIALLEQRPTVALLLSDIVLPGGMNGVEVARRALVLHPELPVLYMSGYTENAIIHDGRLDAGVRLLEKPFTTADLARAVREALGTTDGP